MSTPEFSQDHLFDPDQPNRFFTESRPPVREIGQATGDAELTVRLDAEFDLLDAELLERRRAEVELLNRDTELVAYNLLDKIGAALVRPTEIGGLPEVLGHMRDVAEKQQKLNRDKSMRLLSQSPDLSDATLNDLADLAYLDRIDRQTREKIETSVTKKAADVKRRHAGADPAAYRPEQNREAGRVRRNRVQKRQETEERQPTARDFVIWRRLYERFGDTLIELESRLDDAKANAVRRVA